MRLQCQFDDSDFSFRSLNEPYRYRTQQVIMQVEASTQHIQIPKSSIFEGRRNSGLEGSRMTSWTDMLWNWSHSCDLLQHLWSSFLSSEMTQLRHSDGACAKWLPNFSVTQENAQMVNRILSVGPTFNRKVEVRFPVSLLSKPTAETCWMSFLIACETVKGWHMLTDTHTHTI